MKFEIQNKFTLVLGYNRKRFSPKTVNACLVHGCITGTLVTANWTVSNWLHFANNSPLDPVCVIPGFLAAPSSRPSFRNIHPLLSLQAYPSSFPEILAPWSFHLRFADQHPLLHPRSDVCQYIYLARFLCRLNFGDYINCKSILATAFVSVARPSSPQPSAACHWITMGESLGVLQPLDTRINRDAVTRLNGRHDTNVADTSMENTVAGQPGNRAGALPVPLALARWLSSTKLQAVDARVV